MRMKSSQRLNTDNRTITLTVVSANIRGFNDYLDPESSRAVDEIKQLLAEKSRTDDLVFVGFQEVDSVHNSQHMKYLREEFSFENYGKDLFLSSSSSSSSAFLQFPSPDHDNVWAYPSTSYECSSAMVALCNPLRYHRGTCVGSEMENQNTMSPLSSTSSNSKEEDNTLNLEFRFLGINLPTAARGFIPNRFATKAKVYLPFRNYDKDINEEDNDIRETLQITVTHLSGGRFDDEIWEELTSLKTDQLRCISNSKSDIVFGDFNSDAKKELPLIRDYYNSLTSSSTNKNKVNQDLKIQDFKNYYCDGHDAMQNELGYESVFDRDELDFTTAYDNVADYIYIRKALHSKILEKGFIETYPKDATKRQRISDHRFLWARIQLFF